LFLILGVPIGVPMFIDDPISNWHVAIKLMVLAGIELLLYKLMQWLNPSEYYYVPSAAYDCVLAPEEHEAELDKLEQRFSKGAFQ
jgi:NADH:ubiquinone oxidoreductase subunit 3 (subunit A)